MSKRNAKKHSTRQRQKRERQSKISRGLEHRLSRVAELLEDDELEEARERLEEVVRLHPTNPDVLGLLVNTSLDLGEEHQALAACQRLARVTPDDPDTQLMLAGLAMQCVSPAIARRAFLKLLAISPNDPRAEDVRNTLAELEQHVHHDFLKYPLPAEQMWEIAALHEEMLSLMARGELRRLCEVADQLLKRLPDFAPGWNNKAQALCLLGNLAEARECAQRVLAKQPDNYHALANLAHSQMLAGQLDEAQASAARLQAVQSDHAELFARQAEIFTLLGDDQGVLAALRTAEQAGRPLKSHVDAMLLHFAAAAAARQGDTSQARELWKRALTVMPSLDLAQENLDDLAERDDQRLGPWSFSLPHLVPKQLVGDLLQQTGRSKSSPQRERVRRFLDQHPHLFVLLPIALEKGDPASRELFKGLALWSQSEPWLAALKDFTLSQRGAYRARIDLAMALCQAGVLPSGTMRLWDGYEWTETMLLGFEIYSEPAKSRIKPAAKKLGDQGYYAQQEGDYAQAESLYRQALRIDPQSPTLLNNLSTTLLAQGRTEEALKLQDRIFEQFPDYLFGKTNHVHQLVRQNRLEEAEELLKPLLTKSRLHVSEYSALAAAHVDLLLAQGKREGASSWLDMWEQADPDHPHLAHFRQRLRSGPLNRLRTRLFGGR